MRFVFAVTAVALLIGIPAVSGAAKAPAEGPDAIQYLYGEPKRVPPGKDVEIAVTCPKGTLAVAGGFSQFDSKTEKSDPDVVPVFTGIVGAGKPSKHFDARVAITALRNTGTNTHVMANGRAVCVPGTATELVTGVKK